MSKENSNSPVFLITGCSAGFGRELTLAALASGFRVIATARRLDSMSDLEGKGAKLLALDVNASSEELSSIAEKAIAIYGQVDFLLNNAGYAQGGAIEELSHAESLAQFNTNFFGVINTTKAFLPHFRGRRTGTLVQFSSEAVCNTLPGTGMYSASKAAVEAISDTWAHELAEYGIRSIAIEPSGFRTNFFKVVGTYAPVKTIEGYEAAHGVMDFMQNKYPEIVPGDPVKGARNIIALLTRPDVPLPLRFAVGDDAYKNFKAYYEKRLEELEATKELSVGTNLASVAA